MKNLPILFAIVFFYPSIAPAQTTIDGEDLVLRSSGDDSGNDWVLDENGYVGTYITLASPGAVTVNVEASGLNSPNMNIVLNDTKVGFGVTGGFNNYQHTFDLPAGTHFLRTEMNNDGPANPALNVRELTVTGAAVSNVNSNTNALNAADTYIEHFRKGPAQLQLTGIPAGTDVQVRLKEHQFMFGTAVGGFNNDPGPSDEWTQPNPSPGTDAYILQEKIVEHFNAVVPGNAGKWQQNEFTRDSLFHPVLTNIFNFANANDLRMRMHNLIWDNQQPSWVNTLLNQAAGGNAAAKADLRAEITERINYYIGDGFGSDWSDHYEAVDILNEWEHEPMYMDIFGEDGMADIYAEAAAAVAATGNDVALYANEYNVLQWGLDDYGNWYRRHVEALESEGGQVDGIGIQYYVDHRLANEIGDNTHNAWRIMQILQTLSVTGKEFALTEFGVNDQATEANASTFLDETMRMIFGSPNAAGFVMWGFWAPDTFREGAAFYDDNWNERQPLSVWESLMSQWDTDLNLVTGSGGIVNFEGFYGDYEIIVDGQTYNLTLEKGTTSYEVFISLPGDFDNDGDVDLDDFTILSANMYTPSGAVHDDGDITGDGAVNFDDFVQFYFAFGDTAPESLASIPEPASAAVLVLCTALLTRHRSRSREPYRRLF